MVPDGDGWRTCRCTPLRAQWTLYLLLVLAAVTGRGCAEDIPDRPRAPRVPRAVGEPCSYDKNCEPRREYCAVLKFGGKECRAIRTVGQHCQRDEMCRTGLCFYGRCVMCVDDRHCPRQGACYRNQCVACSDNMHCGDNQFCDNGLATSLAERFASGDYSPERQRVRRDTHRRHARRRVKRQLLEFGLPPPTFTCQFMLPPGRYCQRDNQCATGVCDGAMCLEDRECSGDRRVGGEGCEGEQRCLASQELSIIPRTCVPRQIYQFCKNDTMCGDPAEGEEEGGSAASLFCAQNQCIECNVDNAANCDAFTHYCFAGYCVPKKCRGYCITDFMCLSGRCQGGFCDLCNSEPNFLSVLPNNPFLNPSGK